MHGIIVQMPLPAQLDSRAVQAEISPEKDIEGVNPANLGLLVLAKPRFIPCTAAGVMELLAATGEKLYGKEAVVVGHSEIVGKPLALLLLAEFATVTVCHTKTRDIKAHIRRADILVVAVATPKFITADMVKEGAIVIDVGTNRVEGRLCGDVDFESVKEKVSYISPVPGGVGPMTVVMLMRNVLLAAKRSLEK